MADKLHHVAINVTDLNRAIEWYMHNTDCVLEYSDDTWALIGYENCKLALTIAKEHPPHVCFEVEGAETFGKLVKHRDGTESCYIKDPDGNSVEMLEQIKDEDN